MQHCNKPIADILEHLKTEKLKRKLKNIAKRDDQELELKEKLTYLVNSYKKFKTS